MPASLRNRTEGARRTHAPCRAVVRLGVRAARDSLDAVANVRQAVLADEAEVVVQVAIQAGVGERARRQDRQRAQQRGGLGVGVFLRCTAAAACRSSRTCCTTAAATSVCVWDAGVEAVGWEGQHGQLAELACSHKHREGATR